MSVLRWCGRHKIWAYWIVVFIGGMICSGLFDMDAVGVGRLAGLLFIPYFGIVLAYAATRKRKAK